MTTVKTVGDEVVDLDAILAGQKTVLVFLRHFGWLFCREQAALLEQRKDEIEAAGAKIVAIGNGRPEHAEDFIEKEGISFDVYVDPSRQVYKAYGMKRGVLKVSGPKTTVNSLRARRGGFKQSATKGDALQIGGVVVLDADGQVLFEHIEDEAGDVADYDAVIASLN